MNKLIDLRNEIIECFTCDEEMMSEEGVLERRIDEVLSAYKYIPDDIIWFNISKKMSKYRPFLKYDKDKMRKILKEIIDGNAN